MSEKKLERIVSSRPLPENVVGYHHRFEYNDSTIYGREIKKDDIAAIRAAEKKSQDIGKALKREASNLQKEEDRLGREYQKLDDELFNADTTRSEEIEARKDEIDLRLEAISDRRGTLQEEERDAIENVFALFEDLTTRYVVAVSWKEGKDEKIDFEPQFETRASFNEIGATLVAKSTLGIGEQKNLQRR